MVRHNNMIPNGHFHKKFQSRIKLWFKQPKQKIQRRKLRTQKLRKIAPKPMQLLRPMLHCPSVRYNTKLRAGRGFTLQELKQAGLNPYFARTIGIAVDSRRRNRCVDSLQRNVERLKQYKDKLILCPIKEQKVEQFDQGEYLSKPVKPKMKITLKQITENDRKFNAFVTLRKARCDAKYANLRLKKKTPKCDE